MPKRFFDTELWAKEWYRKLKPEEKGAWDYLVCNCDNVGVLRIDRELANYLIGAPIDWDSLPSKVNGNLEILPNGKFWLIDFCEFQYGELQENCNPHVSYIALLKKHSLISRFLRVGKGYGYPIHRVQDKKEIRTRSEEDKKEDRVDEPLAKGSPRVAEPFAELHNIFNGKKPATESQVQENDDVPF